MNIFGTFDDFDYGDHFADSSLGMATLIGTLPDGSAINNLVRFIGPGAVSLSAPVGGGAVVPEPSSIAMFDIGVLGLFGYSTRRRQTSTAA